MAGPRPIYYARAAAAGLIAGPVAGILLRQAVRAVPFGGLLLTLFMGLALGEIVSRAARRNTSLGLQVIAGLTAALAFLTAGYITGAPVFDIDGWHGFQVVEVNPIRWLLALVGIYLATIRLKD